MMVAMTTAHLPAEVLERAGLPAADVASWAASEPERRESFAAAAEAVRVFLARGQALAGACPAAPRPPRQSAPRARRSSA